MIHVLVFIENANGFLLREDKTGVQLCNMPQRKGNFFKNYFQYHLYIFTNFF